MNSVCVSMAFLAILDLLVIYVLDDAPEFSLNFAYLILVRRLRRENILFAQRSKALQRTSLQTFSLN